jgi:hypothetical protein
MDRIRNRFRLDIGGGKENTKGNPMKNLFFLAALLCFAVPLPAQSPAKPDWTIRKPQDTAEMSYFTSVVDEFTAEDEAIRSAVNQVNNAVANSTIVYIRSSVAERSRTTESQAAFSIDIETDSYTDVILSGIKIETYSERYTNRRNQQRYRAWALAAISKAQTEENLRSYLETIAKRYTLDSAVHRDNLSGALSAYSGVYQALLQNPLHQVIAVYGDGQSLFEYCRLKIAEIANSVSFDLIPPQSVQKGGILTVPVRVSSPLFSSAGALECKVGISGNRPPEGVYTLGRDNSFLLQIPTAGLAEGRYTVRIELQLNAVAPSITRNPQTGFSFEVKPLDTVQIISRNESGPLAGKVAEIMEGSGLMVVDGGGAYRAVISITMNEEKTANYYTLQPLLTITVELGRDGTPLVTYTKKYPLFRHVTRDEAYNRAYRNIEQDLSDNFTAQIRSLGK